DSDSVETDAEADAEASEIGSSEIEASKVEANVETRARSKRTRQVLARWQECELAYDSGVNKE
ncbi:hypothetical protein A2U01_0097337, partial [Trifolium medium]|nr:hypothetical protein [Trifolium medium]